MNLEFKLSAKKRVMVTRPSPQGDMLNQIIIQHGAFSQFVPLINIKAIKYNKKVVNNIFNYDIIIFISRAAVNCSALFLKSISKQQKVYAIGLGTAEELKCFNVTCESSTGVGSESLLKLQTLQKLTGKKVLILKGVGGRSFLQTTLIQKGAKVNTLNVYKREQVVFSKNYLDNFILNKNINIIVITSLMILKTLVQNMQNLLLNKIVLIVPSKRIATEAFNIGIPNVLCSFGASHFAIIKCLSELKTNNYNFFDK